MSTTTHRRFDPSIDQHLALQSAAADLREHFSAVFGVETVDRFVLSSYDQIAENATVANYLPLLAHRFARERLRALARVGGMSRDSRPTVLFLCAHNAGRSQMAMGFARHYVGDRAVVWSGGTHPTGAVNPSVIAAMRERGIDISTEFPKPWTDEIVRAADVVVTLGSGDACPVLPGKHYEDWELDDPAGRNITGVRPIRDEIDRRVRSLLGGIGITVIDHIQPPLTAGPVISRATPRLTARQYRVLQAVADGRVERDLLLGELEPHLLDGKDVIWPLRGLVLRGLVILRPIGPPVLTRRGREVLDSPD